MLKDNDLFICTTDTVLGLGGKINEINRKKIYELKKRDKSKKLIIVIGSIEQLEKIEKLNDIHYGYINQYWPGNTTLIINGTGYRMPKNDKLMDFINEEGPFYLTSANLSNQDPINTIEEAKMIFPNLKYFDFGKGSGKPSNIINLDNGEKIR